MDFHFESVQQQETTETFAGGELRIIQIQSFEGPGELLHRLMNQWSGGVETLGIGEVMKHHLQRGKVGGERYHFCQS